VSQAPIPSGIPPLTAVAAVILVGANGYLLQHRSELCGIWYPGYWGLFGGTLDPGETDEAALRRELLEELGWAPAFSRHFMDARFDFNFSGGPISRRIFEVEIDETTLATLQLREGAEMRVIAPASFGDFRIVPTDQFVLDLHVNSRGRWTDGSAMAQLLAS
jgi:8-oxo-dGTP diphosphatase